MSKEILAGIAGPEGLGLTNLVSGAKGLAQNGAGSVSYTHLDVYKRQDFSLIVCAYDTGLDREGWQDVANIKEDIIQRGCKAPYFGGAFTVLKPITWALQEDDTHPYYCLLYTSHTSTSPNTDSQHTAHTQTHNTRRNTSGQHRRPAGRRAHL